LWHLTTNPRGTGLRGSSESHQSGDGVADGTASRHVAAAAAGEHAVSYLSSFSPTSSPCVHKLVTPINCVDQRRHGYQSCPAYKRRDRPSRSAVAAGRDLGHRGRETRTTGISGCPECVVVDTFRRQRHSTVTYVRRHHHNLCFNDRLPGEPRIGQPRFPPRPIYSTSCS